MKSEVYFTRAGAQNFNDSIIDRLVKMFDRVGAGSIIKEKEFVALKGHFGEEGNVSFVSPVYYRPIADRVKTCGGSPFLTDTNTLYGGQRNHAVNHINVALKHGFSYATVGAPVIIADGLLGKDFVEVPINKKHVKKAKVASAVYWADSMIVITHCKGHMITGLGGAIKNVGMGCASRGGKQEQHSGTHPNVSKKKCTACKLCEKWCDAKAITVIDGVAVIDEKKCTGCGECIAVCRFDAIDSRWDEEAPLVQEKMAEYAYAVLQNKKDKVVYFNFIINVTPECDCMPSSDNYLIPDIGILASFDPVAIDAASIELTNKAKAIDMNIADKKGYDLKYTEKDKFKMVHPEIDWKYQINYAFELGLGNKEYELLEVK